MNILSLFEKALPVIEKVGSIALSVDKVAAPIVSALNPAAGAVLTEIGTLGSKIPTPGSASTAPVPVTSSSLTSEIIPYLTQLLTNPEFDTLVEKLLAGQTVTITLNGSLLQTAINNLLQAKASAASFQAAIKVN